MVRYIMSFTVKDEQALPTQKAITDYFLALEKHGPGGMRSQCYATDEKINHFIHIKSFTKESIAHAHFRSPLFRNYMDKIMNLSGQPTSFTRLWQQQSFESIY